MAYNSLTGMALQRLKTRVTPSAMASEMVAMEIRMRITVRN